MIESKVLSFFILLSFFGLGLSAPACPNSCNKRGRCTARGTCQCFAQYMGPDCSLFKCPLGTAWVDYAYGPDLAHRPAECSNMGTCDRLSGNCICRQGYTGRACDRMDCPNQCNLREMPIYIRLCCYKGSRDWHCVQLH